jgi:hypothetical protein
VKAVLTLLLAFVVVNLLFLVAGVGIGLLLRLVLPSIDLGTGVLIGVVSTGLSIHFFLRLMALAEVHDVVEPDVDRFTPPVWVYPSRSGRKRKRNP